MLIDIIEILAMQSQRVNEIRGYNEGLGGQGLLDTLPWVLLGLFSLWLFVRMVTRLKENKEKEKREARKKKLAKDKKERNNVTARRRR
jgi:hypothetical protein